MTEQARAPEPDDKALVPPTATQPSSVPARKPGEAWEGPTYYGRPQLKAAPFNNWVVGGYTFLAGLSGSSAILSALADLTRGETAGRLVRRGRYLSLLAPTLGSVLLIWDLHTPKRFYNMLRVAKATSPMSIGTWTLLSFSAAAGLAAAGQFVADRVPGLRWLRRAARVASVPAAAAGMGMSTYTAALLSATSTPLWAAAPRSMAVRLGASSVASAAAALALPERSRGLRTTLDAVCLAALTAELAGLQASHAQYRRTGVDAALSSAWGRTERAGAGALGTVLPLVLHAALFLAGSGRGGGTARLARLLALGGAALLRVSIMGAGDVSAERPGVSFRFAQPENLPRVR